jgi:flagellar hook-associated protein 3 FlgL
MAVGFRVADSTRYAGLVPQYNRLVGQQIDVQTEIASGKRYQRADQNPTDIGLAQRFHVDDRRLEQNVKNIGEVQSFSDFTTSAITTATDIVQRASELAVSANDATKSQAERLAIATEIERMLQGLVDIGAQNYRGRYLFSGTQTDQASFTTTTNAQGYVNAVTFTGNGSPISAEYAPGRLVQYNMLGSNENGGDFGLLRDTAAGVDIFQSMMDFRDTLLNSTTGVGSAIQEFSDALTHLQVGAVRVGSVQNRMSSAEALHEDQREVLGDTIGKLTDTDYADAATRLQQLETAYQAALQVGSRVGNLSLLNYLR